MNECHRVQIMHHKTLTIDNQNNGMHAMTDAMLYAGETMGMQLYMHAAAAVYAIIIVVWCIIQHQLILAFSHFAS